MTVFTLASNLPNDSFADWSDIALWQGGQIPNGPSAQVFLNNISPNFYFVEVMQSEPISIGSFNMQSNDLLLYGSLRSAGSVTVAAPAEIQIYGGALSAQSLRLAGGGGNDVGIVGVGTVSVAAPLYNNSAIVSGNAEGLSTQTALTVSAAYIQNNGLLEASVNSTLTVEVTQTGGIANYVWGTLVGGTYEVESGGTLDLQTNGLVHSLSAHVVYDGLGAGTIATYDPRSGHYVSLEQTLGLVTRSGTLELDAGTYSTSGTLSVAGTLTLFGDAKFSAGTLYLPPNGQLNLLLAVPGGGQEVSGGRVIDDGNIFADGSGGGVAVINAPVLGGGTITIGPAVTIINEHMQSVTTTATLELTQSDSNAIRFSDGTGAVILDNPASVTGHFQDFRAGDKIELPNVALSSITAHAYTKGMLTLKEGNGVLHFAFDGSYSTADFLLQAGANGAGTLIVGVAPAVSA